MAKDPPTSGMLPPLSAEAMEAISDDEDLPDLPMEEPSSHLAQNQDDDMYSTHQPQEDLSMEDDNVRNDEG